MRSLEFGFDGREYRLSAELDPPAGFEAVAEVEAIDLVRCWARQSDGIHDTPSALLPTIPFRADRQWLRRQLLEEIDRGRGLRLYRATRPIPEQHVIVSDLADLLADDHEQEAQEYWVEIELLDRRDTPIVFMECEVELPNGRVVTARSNDLGIIRIDGVSKAGQCTIRTAPPVPIEIPPIEPRTTFMEAIVLTPTGEPIAGLACRIDTPDGESHDVVTDGAGVVRLEGLTEPGICHVEFPDLAVGG